MLPPDHDEDDDVMTGQFNVAVAEVDVREDGSPTDSPDGERLSRYLAERLTGELAALDVEAQVWPPERTGRVTGETPGDRREAAASRAAKIGADILVHGLVIDAGRSGTR